MQIGSNVKNGILILLSFITIAIILSFTNSFVDKVRENEKRRIELFAQAQEEIATSDNFGREANVILKVIVNNKSIPALIVDDNDNIITFRNIDKNIIKNKILLKKEIQKMAAYHAPIIIKGKTPLFLYYNESNLLKNIKYYPLIIVTILIGLMGFIYFILTTSKKSEQSQLWVSMAKETAHQIGTPLSSLMGWYEFLKEDYKEHNQVLKEIGNDLKRLNTISSRFSKIGSTTKLEKYNINEVIENVVNYFKLRFSKNIETIFIAPKKNTTVQINLHLFEWVLENLIKNAIDSMKGKGRIEIKIKEDKECIHIYLSDTGTGMKKSDVNKIFKTGFTTKKRGWGMGLSLAKRVIENYHNGKIFVLKSDINKGTTFVITLKNHPLLCL